MYPQAILIFCITIIYSVISPLILVFGAAYFGIGYLVYKQKLLFGQSAHPDPRLTSSSVFLICLLLLVLTVFYKPYESAGQAWPITFTRLLLGVIIFQVRLLSFLR